MAEKIWIKKPSNDVLRQREQEFTQYIKNIQDKYFGRA